MNSVLKDRQPATPSQPLSLGDRVVILIMFLLPIPIFLGDAAARCADVVRFGTTSGHLLFSPRLSWGRHVWRTSAILLLMFLFACVSLAIGTSHTLRDMLDVLRIAAFWTVFLFGASVAWKGRSNASALIAFSQLMLAIGVLNAVFTIGQFYFPNVTRPLQLMYAIGELRLLRMDLISEQGRAIGFFSNPNTNAIMLLLLALPSIALFQLTLRRSYLVLGAFVFATILLTASRTGLILLAVVVTVLCVASRKLGYMAALAVICCGAYFTLGILVETDLVRDWFPYLTELLVKVHGAIKGEHFDVESINSFHERLLIWERTLEWYHLSPVLGSGPLRDELHSFADNYYVYLLSRYGMVGLVLYVSFSIYILTISISAIVSGARPIREWGIVTLAALVTVNVANYTIDAFLTVPIGPLLLLYAGYLTCLADMHRNSASQHRRKPIVGRFHVALGSHGSSLGMAFHATDAGRRYRPPAKPTCLP
jgi:hypothetical protein